MRTFALAIALVVPGCALDDRARGDDDTTTTPPTITNSNCPDGETCSDLTPHGLDFNGIQPVFDAYPNGSFSNVNHQIATGGTHDVSLAVLVGGTLGPIAFPFTAVSADTTILAVEGTDGPHVTLRAHGGTTYLRILDPETGELFDREAYASSPLATLLPVPAIERVTAPDFVDETAASFVFAAGEQTIGVALLGAQSPAPRLIDTSQTLAFDGADQPAWDQLHIPQATVGHHAITVTSGNGDTHVLDIEIVDHADAIAGFSVYDSIACFAATAHGAFISGLAWTFTIAGTQTPSQGVFGPNCIWNPDGSSGPFTVTATAGGLSTTYTTVATSPTTARRATSAASPSARN